MTTKLKPKAIDEAFAACEILVQAYTRGARNGGSVDWNDVNDAWQSAKAALRIRRQERIAARDRKIKAITSKPSYQRKLKAAKKRMEQSLCEN